MDLTQEAVDLRWAELVRPMRRRWNLRRYAMASGVGAIVVSGTITAVALLAVVLHQMAMSLSNW
jgi:hypothetical protein